MSNIENFIDQEIEMWNKLSDQRSSENSNKKRNAALMQTFVRNKGKLYRKKKTSNKMGIPKECFKNAFLYLFRLNDEERKKHRYVEGYIMLSNIPLLIHHAWVEGPDGSVIEVTIPNVNAEYFGVPFSFETAQKWILKNSVYGILDTGFGLNVELMKKFLWR